MKIIYPVIALAIATLFTTTFSFANSGEHGDHELKIILMAGSEPIEIDGSDMEVGESQQFYTDSGKEVVVSRGEDGFTVTLDGQEILKGGGGLHMQGMLDGLHGAHSQVFIKHFGDDDDVDVDVRCLGAKGLVNVLIDGAAEWHEDGEHRVMVLGMGDFKSPAQRLTESGVLDNVDEGTREEILKVLRDAAPHHRIGAHRIVIDSKEKEGEEN